MDLVLELLPFLLATYLVDSALVVRSGQLLFVSGWGGRFAACPPGLRFPGLAPQAEAYLAAALPLRACERGVLVPAGRKSAERLVPFESMSPVTAADGRVRLDATTSFTVRPRALAPELARIVERLRTSSPPRRLPRLRRELRRRCDPPALLALRARQARWLPVLKALSGGSAVALAVVLPASLVPELAWRPSPLAAGALVLALYAATLSAAAAMLRGCGVGWRAVAGALLPVALFPPAIAHAPSVVARELYLGFEPLALGAQLLPPAGLAALLRGGGGQAPPEQSRSPDAEGCWDLPLMVEGIVRAASERAAARRPRPTPSFAGAASFCPSCLAEYRAGYDRCSDCDVALEPFAR